MRMGRGALAMLLMTNVVELRFKRRIEKPGVGDYRRMLCTNDKGLLSSTLGRNILNYDSPKGPGLAYNPADKNLVVAWDIFLQAYRMINCNEVDVISVLKTSPDPKQFWEYFNQNLLPMPAAQKASFMNK